VGCNLPGSFECTPIPQTFSPFEGPIFVHEPFVPEELHVDHLKNQLDGQGGRLMYGKKKARQLSELQPLGLSPCRVAPGAISSVVTHPSLEVKQSGQPPTLLEGPFQQGMPGAILPFDMQYDHTRDGMHGAFMNGDSGIGGWAPALAFSPSDRPGNAITNQGHDTNFHEQGMRSEGRGGELAGREGERRGNFRKRAPQEGINIDGRNFGSMHQQTACEEHSAAEEEKTQEATRRDEASFFRKHFPVLSSMCFANAASAAGDKRWSDLQKLRKKFPEALARRLRPKKRFSVHGGDFGSHSHISSGGSFRAPSLFRTTESYQEKLESVSSRRTAEKGSLMVNTDYTRRVSSLCSGQWPGNLKVL
jgi:hypothetical protein